VAAAQTVQSRAAQAKGREMLIAQLGDVRFDSAAAAKTLNDAVAAGIKKPMRQFALTWQRLAAQLSPKLTGHNARGIAVEVWEDGVCINRYEGPDAGNRPPVPLPPRFTGVLCYTTSGYGAYPELGTARQGAQPYLYPSMQIAAKTLFDELQGCLKWR